MLVTAGHIQCRRCSKFRHPAEFVGGTFGYCLQCYEHHQRAVKMLAEGLPTDCQECGVSASALLAATGSDDLRMEVHIKDGMYQVLCLKCGDEYARKRADLYAETPFAKEKQLF